MGTSLVQAFQICLIAVLFFISQAEYIQRKTEEGQILGRTFTTVEENKTCFAFQGIPFAEPPKRFQLAVPKVSWTGTLNCTYDQPECVQGGLGPVTGSEDCLFLSVYSPNLTGNASVLFWIHGGGFMLGNGSYAQNGPDHFLNRGLLVVIIQYRLGVFGFMSTGDLACPGNLGLKDQALALDWTRRNIHHFGGNPDKITISGVSAGAASAGYFLISPKTKGKFSGVIMNSGNPECLWSLNRQAVKIAFKTGESLGKFTTNSTDLVLFLKGVKYDQLQTNSMLTANSIMIQNFLIGIEFGIVEEIVHDDAFYTGKADELFSNGNFHRVPILAGFAASESAGVDPSLINLIMSFLDLNPKNLAPASLTTNDCNRTKAALDIRIKFFNNTFIPMVFQTERSINFLNVDLFVKPIDRFIRNVIKYEKRTYYYMFNYVGVLGGVTNRIFPGTQHSEDMGYLWVRNTTGVPQQDISMRDNMVTMWTSFCQNGMPVPKCATNLDSSQWLAASSSSPPFLMKLDSKLGKIINPYQTYLTFYQNEIFNKYGQGNYNTY